MRLKTVFIIVLAGALGLVMTSYFAGSLFLSKVVVEPFHSLGIDGVDTAPGVTSLVVPETDVKFVSAEFFKGWIPWVIKQVSILIGALSLLVFGYAGVTLIVYGDNEDQLSTSTKMIVFGIVGIALAAFSYTIIDNVLLLF